MNHTQLVTIQKLENLWPETIKELVINNCKRDLRKIFARLAKTAWGRITYSVNDCVELYIYEVL